MIDEQKEGWGRPLGSIGVTVLREKEQRHSEDTTGVLGSTTHVILTLARFLQRVEATGYDAATGNNQRNNIW
jgi:hypothetical protein